MENTTCSLSAGPPAARRLGRRAGLALALLFGLTFGLELAAGRVYVRLVPGATEYPLWLTWLLSFGPLYCVAFPVYCTLLESLPRIVPVRRRLPARRLAAFACVAFALLYVGSLIGNGLNLLIGWLRGEPPLSGLAELVGSSPVWQTVVFTCVLAPVGEELLFRKLLLEHTLVFGEKNAMVFTALAFGLFHGNLYQMFYAFLVGLALAWLRLRSGSLPLCMAVHAGINLFGGVLGPMMLGAGRAAIAAYGAVVLAVVTTGVVVLCRSWKRLRFAAPRPGVRARWLFASPGALAALVLCLAVTVLSALQ